MIYSFSERKEKNSMLEEQLGRLRKEYESLEMPDIQVEKLKNRMREAAADRRKGKYRARLLKMTAAAAGLTGMLILLPNTSAAIAHAMEQLPVIGRFVEVVTFRNYEYESDRNMADIEIPEISVEEVRGDGVSEESLNQTAGEINAEIRETANRLIGEFEAGLQMEEGYQDIVMDSEVLAVAPGYFTLKISCYNGSGSGYEWNYFYTIDLNTGDRLKMKDLFVPGADYITPISDSIKEQMREQMAADEDVYYWLEDEIEGLNFRSITDETSFYLNEKGNLVICFNEGDVAPMYMGTVEFEIPAEALEEIRKYEKTLH